MKIGLNTDRTTETCTHSMYSLHNCPSCKCSKTTIYQNISNSPQYFHKINEPRMRQNNLYNGNSSIPTIIPPNNIYVCKTTDILPVGSRSMNQLFRSSVFDTKRRDEYLDSRSLARANITFTYISPKKEKPHRSSDCRFSTKQFKQKHFPFLQCHQKSIETQEQSNTIKDNPYYTTYTKQSPPKKHKVLRINKSKSKNKLKTISSHLSQKQLSIKQYVKPVTPKQRQNQEYQVDYPTVTPINALWEKLNQSPVNSHKNIAEMMIKPHNPFHRPSIEHMDLQKSVSSEQVITQKQTTRKQSENNLIYQKPLPLNSVQSLVRHPVDVMNFTKVSNQQPFNQDISHYQVEEKSQFWKQRSIKLSEQLQIKGLEGLSQQLSEELQLHYDYYCPNYDYFIAKNDSDRSVSMSVSLY